VAENSPPTLQPAVPVTDWSQYGVAPGPPDWTQYGVVRSPSALQDIAQSIPAGAVEGGVAMAGAPGALSELIQQGARQFGYVPPPPTGQPGTDVRLPRPAELQSAVEQFTGPLYESKTGLGGAARSVAREWPAAVTGPSTLATRPATAIGNVVRYGVIPGLTAELTSQIPGVKGTDLEPYARAAAGIFTGGLAGAVARPATAERVISHQLPPYVTPQHVRQAQGLIDNAEQMGVTLTWSEALSHVTGREVLLDLQRILESSRRSRGIMQEALGERPRQVETAGRGEIAPIGPAIPSPDVIGPQVGRAAEEVERDVRRDINRATQPYYDTASRVLLTPTEMAQVRAIPGYPQAARAVRNDPQLNRNVAHLPENSVGFLNEVKQYFDTQGKNAASAVQRNPNQTRAAGFKQSAGETRQIALDAADRAHPGGPNPYQVALDVQEQSRRIHLEPLMQGPIGRLAQSDITTQRAIEALFPKNPLAGSQDDVRQAVTALSMRNPAAARALVRAHLEMELDKAFEAAGRTPQAAGFVGAGFAQQVAGSPVINSQRLQNLRAAVEALPNGPANWQGFERFLEVMRATGWRQPIGSRTAFNAADLHALETGNIGNILKEAASPERWLNLVHEYWGRWQAGRNMENLATILTDPRSGPILERLAQHDVGSQAAAILTARLIAIGATAPGGGGQPKPVK
jgi:hypothetical protein